MTKFIVVVLLLAMFAGGCGTPQAAVMERPADDVLASYQKSMTQAHNRFGFHVYRALPDRKANVLVSPVSLSMAFAMALNGAAGDTRHEMAQVMGLSEWEQEQINRHLLALLYYLRTADPEVVLEIANSVWMKEGVPFEEDFIEVLEQYLLAETNALDFTDSRAADTINDWVKSQTRGLIPEIVEPPIDPLTILYLINAVYFDGYWSDPFDKEQTRDEMFTNLDGTRVTVPMMMQTGDFSHYAGDGFQLVRLPYGEDRRISMNVILPDENTEWQLFLADWDQEIWAAWRERATTKSGTVALPRFEFSWEMSLGDILKSLGMEAAFQPDMADFTDMVPAAVHDDVHISDVVHKTRIRVSEEGTEAAAVTSIEVGITSMPVHEFDMHADRPFIFLIEDDDTGAILFLGHVTSLRS